MNRFAAVISVLIFATTVRANLYVPDAHLAGETVSVVMAREYARVTGVYQFADWVTRDHKIAYFPIYSSDPDATRTLSMARFEFRVGAQEGMAMPCKPPRKYSLPPSGVYVHWYCIPFDEVVGDDAIDFSKPLPIIRVSYNQPLIGGKFFYLPVIPADPGASSIHPDVHRAWTFQLHARSAVRRMGVQSKCDSEILGDSITVYLQDDIPVVLE